MQTKYNRKSANLKYYLKNRDTILLKKRLKVDNKRAIRAKKEPIEFTQEVIDNIIDKTKKIVSMK